MLSDKMIMISKIGLDIELIAGIFLYPQMSEFHGIFLYWIHPDTVGAKYESECAFQSWFS
jgi:hypothetical protein